MVFSELHQNIRQVFNPEQEINHTPEGVDIRFFSFHSANCLKTAESEDLHKLRQLVPGGKDDEKIVQNQEFIYPVFTPSSVARNSGAILLLHGLNERKYDKYYAWAHRLVKDTGKSVILFPISFHLNRGLPLWIDRHAMMEKAEQRRMCFKTGSDEYTFINQALSERLSESPERFFLSGLQTSCDLIYLLNEIRDGKHPHFLKDTRTDLFAYSIGGLLGQVLYISNPDNLFSDSKLFLFCAGSLFGDMKGISKLIMDPPAYQRIHKYYTIEMEENIKKSSVFADFFNHSKIGMAFRSMITPEGFSSVREKVFKGRAREIFAISLKKDKVIPPSKIRKVFSGKKGAKMEVYDFEYPYCHEMPFPMKLPQYKDKIDEAFEKVFLKAGIFLQ